MVVIGRSAVKNGEGRKARSDKRPGRDMRCVKQHHARRLVVAVRARSDKRGTDRGMQKCMRCLSSPSAPGATSVVSNIIIMHALLVAVVS